MPQPALPCSAPRGHQPLLCVGSDYTRGGCHRPSEDIRMLMRYAHPMRQIIEQMDKAADENFLESPHDVLGTHSTS
jgi:hypothetical protein